MNWINQDLIIVLVGYLNRMITLTEMRNWLAENVWSLSDSSSPLDRMILGELELVLAEYDRGDRDEHYLRERFWMVLHLPNPELSSELRNSLLTLLPG